MMQHLTVKLNCVLASNILGGLRYYHMSLGCKEDNPNVHCNLVHSLMMLCDWREVHK